MAHFACRRTSRRGMHWSSVGIGAGVVATAALAVFARRKKQAAQPHTRSKHGNAPKDTTGSKRVPLRIRGAGKDAPLGVSRCESFPWGSDAFTFQYVPHCAVLGAALVAGAIAVTTPSGPMVLPDGARGPVMVTLGWIWSYFNMIGFQVTSKGNSEQASKVAERSLMNTLEQSVPFFSMMWATAACIDAALATSLGVVCALASMLEPCYVPTCTDEEHAWEAALR